MNLRKMLFSKITETDYNGLFDDIIGYDDIKRLFRMALHADSAIHILLVGRPASAKTMFLICGSRLGMLKVIVAVYP